MAKRTQGSLIAPAPDSPAAKPVNTPPTGMSTQVVNPLHGLVQVHPQAHTQPPSQSSSGDVVRVFMSSLRRHARFSACVC